jgi:hypothetical protein
LHRGVRKFSEDSPRRRGGRRVKSFLVKIDSELCELRVSAVKSLLPLGCGSAALSSLRLNFRTRIIFANDLNGLNGLNDWNELSHLGCGTTPMKKNWT